MRRLQTQLHQRVQHFRLQRAGIAGQRGKCQCSQHVTGQHNGPQPHRAQQMFPGGEDQSHGVQRVLCEELRTAQYDYDEAKWIEHACAEGGNGAVSQQPDRNGCAERGQPHKRAARKSGDGQRRNGAFQLIPGIVQHLAVYFFRTGPVQMLLRRVLLRLRSFLLATSGREVHYR